MATRPNEPDQGKPKQRKRREEWGRVRQQPGGRWQASYRAIDPETGLPRTYTARTRDNRPLTFDTAGAARKFLAATRTDIERGIWRPPGHKDPDPAKPITLSEYGIDWLTTRPLAVRTRELYTGHFRNHIEPAFGHLPLAEIRPVDVRRWHSRDAKPTAKAHSYAILRTILKTAAADGIITSNPCTIPKAGKARTAKKIRPLTVPEVAGLVAELPAKYRMLAELLFWCSLRFGEAAGLQRADIDLKHGLIHVRRGVVRTKTGLIVAAPKTEAGTRAVTLPSHLNGPLGEHLKAHTAPGKNAWVFPGAGGGPLAASTFAAVFDPAAERVGRPDVTPHVLRHSGQTLAAQLGANLRELMARAGQVSPGAALRYLHDADTRQREIADKMAALASGDGSGQA